MNKPANFEIAKLLKEKGFEGAKSPLWYYKDGTLHESRVERYKGLECWNTWDATQGVRWDAPTIAEVVMWMYEKHGIWIDVGLYTHLGNTSKFQFTIQSQKSKSTNSIVQLNTNPFNSAAKAYEAGIKYVLETLI
jgi:hypothetical protein